jgi:hypothetical protein
MADAEKADDAVWLGSRKWLIAAALPADDSIQRLAEGCFIRRVDGEVFACPWRTRLRMLAGLLAFRTSIPEEIADAFVPYSEAERAARELASLGERYPEARSHILHANWHVPLRWFVPFDESERVLVEDKAGLRIRYETSLQRARGRLAKASEILESSSIDDNIAEAVRELAGWVREFPSEGLVELDYASVAAAFEDEELVNDQSAAEVWTCLDALAGGDLIRAAAVFESLSERWAAVRVQEVAN